MRVSSVPAGTDATTFAILEVSIVERMFKPQTTSAFTLAVDLPLVTGTVIGGVGGVPVDVDEPEVEDPAGVAIPPPAVKHS